MTLRAPQSRLLKVWKYRGWNVICRGCKAAVPSGTGESDHGSWQRAYWAATFHLDLHRKQAAEHFDSLKG